MRYISRNSHDAFRDCPRAGYWRYLSGPWGEGNSTRGLEPAGPPPSYLTLGIAWHMAAEKLLGGAYGEDAAAPAVEWARGTGLDEASLNWILGASLAWERAMAEEFFDRWEVVTVEEELETPLTPNVVLYTRADAVLRDRVDGTFWVLNWKTAADLKGWNRKWFYDVQSWTESLAAEAKLGIPVAGCLYYGISKGPMYQGKTSSRLVYGYRYKTKTGEITYGTENNGGGTRFSVWNESFPFGDGVAAWVNFLPKDYLKTFFAESAPQIRQDELVEGWLRQVVGYESDVDHILSTGSAQDKLDFFWQNWGEQTCGRCPFSPLCTLKSTPEELISDGFLLPRRKSPRDEAEERAAANE